MFHHRFDNATLIARRCTRVHVSAGARRLVLISQAFPVSGMKHDRNHRENAPAYLR